MSTVEITGRDSPEPRRSTSAATPRPTSRSLRTRLITAVAPVGAGTVDVRVVTPAGTIELRAAGTDSPTCPPGSCRSRRRVSNLEIGGVPTLFTGFNAYQLATDWGTNAGCGGMASAAQIDAFFASLRPDSLVRFWAFQGTIATNVHTGQLDWQPLDNVFYAGCQIPRLPDPGDQ